MLLLCMDRRSLGEPVSGCRCHAKAEASTGTFLVMTEALATWFANRGDALSSGSYSHIHVDEIGPVERDAWWITATHSYRALLELSRASQEPIWLYLVAPLRESSAFDAPAPQSEARVSGDLSCWQPPELGIARTGPQRPDADRWEHRRDRLLWRAAAIPDVAGEYTVYREADSAGTYTRGLLFATGVTV